MGVAVTAGLDQIDEVGEEAGLTATRKEGLPEIDPDDAGPEVVLPDGRRIFVPRVHGERIDTLACSLVDLDNPAASRYLQLIGPPGTGKSQIGRVIALELWTRRDRPVEERNGEPFYGYVEISGGPSSDEYTFRYDYVPATDKASDVRLVPSAFVEAMRNGWTVMIDEPNTIRDVALLSLNAVFDGRLALYLPALAETVIAQPGFTALLAYNPGLVSSTATDIPSAWYSRFPACIEVTSNWPALVKLGAPKRLVEAAAESDRQRMAGEDGITWSPQFREIEALHDMMTRAGERHGLSLFISSLVNRLTVGEISEAEAAAACRMLDSAGYDKYKVTEASGKPNLDGYPRAASG